MTTIDDDDDDDDDDAYGEHSSLFSTSAARQIEAYSDPSLASLPAGNLRATGCASLKPRLTTCW
jgi:hypothetical protein